MKTVKSMYGETMYTNLEDAKKVCLAKKGYWCVLSAYTLAQETTTRKKYFLVTTVRMAGKCYLTPVFTTAAPVRGIMG